ncbi:Adaptin N terminal region containing protein [Novymonas esmeraldas]|uniref:Adaptin N terminal region containing protein n=1 Tax=Novymonas esmeraldas TaxID=1808958 RepID=A0AAW0EJD8_9TRYP
MSKFYSAETQQGHSSHFLRLIRQITEAVSTQEEDQIIEDDLKDLKATLTSSAAQDADLMKEYAVRAYYAELMGHSAEFAYIHCINLASSTQLNFKRTGYLATGLMVHPSSELMYLMVATIQRDLRSLNYLEVSAALTAAARMLRPELLTVIQEDVAGLLRHEKALVRRKAAEALHAFYVRSDGAVGDVSAFRQALCDRDPSVMDAATRLLQEVVLRDAAAHRDLLDSFIFILSQVIERRLPRAYEYHRMPAPWLQIRAIRLLTILIGDDVSRAEKAAHVLTEAMQRADNGLLIGFAVVCELVHTATSIPPLPGLLRLAADAVSGLLTARNPNLRCAGIQALSYMARVHPDLAAAHQDVVIQCLGDADETIRRKTIWVLFAICGRHNIAPIAHRLIRFLQKVGDPFLKRSTARGLCRLMEQHATDPWWYIRTMNRVLAAAGECVLPTTVQRMLKLIAEGQGVSEEGDTAFRIRCVDAYVAITGGGGGGGLDGFSSAAQALPDVLRRVAAWVIGEYGFLASHVSRAMLLDRLCDVMEHTSDGETRCWIVTAWTKVVAQAPSTPPQQQHSLAQPHAGAAAGDVEELTRRFQDSQCVPLQQRCYEFGALLRESPALLRRVLPLDGFCEDVHVDAELAFLDDFVKTAVAGGARPYAKPADVAALQRRLRHALDGDGAADSASALRTAAYVPTRPMDVRPVWSATESAAAVPVHHGAEAGTRAAPHSGISQSVLDDSERLVLHPGATKRWGAANVREVEAAEEEVHLQVAAAAAVGGGGVVWGADTSIDAPVPVASTPSAAVPHSADAARHAPSSDAKPVSARDVKFARSIFGSGRRKTGASRTLATSAAHAVAPSTLSTSAPGGVMDSLFSTSDAAAAAAARAAAAAAVVPPASSHGGGGRSGDGASPSPSLSAAWFALPPASVAAASSAASPSSTATSSLLVSLQPADASFSSAAFESAWRRFGTAGECSAQLQSVDLSDYTARGGQLQQRVLPAAGLRVVEVIGKDIIAAAQFRPAVEVDTVECVVAHCIVVSATRLNVTIRASVPAVSAEVLRRLQAA